MLKKTFYLVFAFFVFFLSVGVVSAAPSATLSVSSGTVENGKTVTATVTIKNVAAWNIKIISSGNTNGCSQSFADATSNGGNATKTFSVTCKATSIGAIGFTLSGDATSADGNTVNVSGSKRVTVVQPRPASQNNYLKSITVGEYELNPAFDEEVGEYTITVPSTVNEITINAQVKDRYASLSGTGTFEVNEGSNPFTITVTAESGATREYKVIVNVEDLNPIVVEADGTSYTIMKNVKNVEVPTLFTASTTTVGDIEIPTFISDANSFVLVAARDESGKVFYLIQKEDGTYTVYRYIIIGSLIFYVYNYEGEFTGYYPATLTLGDYVINAYQSEKDDAYYLVYGMNMTTNVEGWYKYDSKENTLQRFNIEQEAELEEKANDYFMIMLLFGGALLVCIIALIASIFIGNKRVKRIILSVQSKGNVIVPEPTKKNKKAAPTPEKLLEQTKEFTKEELKAKEEKKEECEKAKPKKEPIKKGDKKEQKEEIKDEEVKEVIEQVKDSKKESKQKKKKGSSSKE